MKEERMKRYRAVLRDYPMFEQAARKTEEKLGNLKLSDMLYVYGFAPAITAYTEWVCRDASQRGIERLYFLSRDGAVLYEIAKELIKMRMNRLELRNLHISRRSVRVPEFHLISEDAMLAYLFGNAMDISLRAILKRSGITDEESVMFAAKDCGEQDPDRILTRDEVAELTGNSNLAGYMSETAKRRSLAEYPAAISYFKQEGLFDNVSYAVADSGWIGTQQRSLERLLQSEAPEVSLYGYYFGLYEQPDGISGKCFPYYFSPSDHFGRKAEFCNNMFEALSANDEGMTIRYEEQESGIVSPVFDTVNPNAESAKRRMELAKCYAKEYATLRLSTGGRPLLEEKETTAYMCERLFRHLMAFPEPDEVSAFGNLMFCDDSSEHLFSPLAKPLTKRDILHSRVLPRLLREIGIRKDRPDESAWLAGSVVRSYGARKIRTKQALYAVRRYKFARYFKKLLQ